MTESAAVNPPAAYAPPEAPLTHDAITLSRMIHAGELDCETLMRATLARIDAVNPRANAIVALRPAEELIAEAREADAALARGESRGWLHGIPQAPKDLADARGIVTSRGSPIFKDLVAERDSLHIARARAEGAIMIGKTNVPEFGLGSQSYNSVYGATRNAHAPDLCAGGSSGGAAVALALNILAVADGSDMMGSLRNPAGFNGVYGFRPSFGRVPNVPGLDQFFQQLGVEGPMGRSPRDCARLLATQAGYDPLAPLSLEGDGSEFSALAQAAPADRSSPLAGLRIGWLADHDGYLAMEAGILEQSERALRALEALGAAVEPTTLGYAPEKLWSTWLTLRQGIQGSTLSAHYDDPARRALLKPEVVWEVENAKSASAVDFYLASAERTNWYLASLNLFARYDLLAVPTAQVFPFDVRTHWPREVAGRAMDTYHRWMEVVLPATLGGLPAISVPCPTTESERAAGRISGLQLVGGPRADAAVLAAAIAYADAQG